ncbi:anti-sigma regulatory factor [Nakamurella sp. GG22]
MTFRIPLDSQEGIPVHSSVAVALAEPSQTPDGAPRIAQVRLPEVSGPERVRVWVNGAVDVVIARRRGRELGAAAGFADTDLTLIATAISEVARNIVAFAAPGEITITPVSGSDRHGITVVARDKGPGIGNVDRALRDGFSTGDGLGIGLPGARRVMDEFRIHSEVGEGTTIWMTKWRPAP